MSQVKFRGLRDTLVTGSNVLQSSIAGKTSLLAVLLLLSSTVAFAVAPLPAPETDPEALQLTERGFFVVSDPSRSVEIPGRVRFYDRSGDLQEDRTISAEWLSESGEVEDVRRYEDRWLVSASRLRYVQGVSIIIGNFSEPGENYLEPDENYLFSASGNIVKSENRTHLVASDSGYSEDRIFYLRTEGPVKDIPDDVDVYSENYNLTSENIYKDHIRVEGADLSDGEWVIASSEEESVSLNFYNSSWDKVRTLDLDIPGWNSSYEVNDLAVNGTEYWILADKGQFGGEVFVTDNNGALASNYTVGIYPNQSQIVQEGVREYERQAEGKTGQLLLQIIIIVLSLILVFLLGIIVKDL